MDDRTLSALKASIVAWEKKLQQDDPYLINLGPDACPLCQLFNSTETEDPCVGCPVYDRTGLTACRHTPYAEAMFAIIDWRNFKKPEYREAARAAIQKEIDFLKSFLPGEDDEQV